jgi:hypothetical protein
MCDLESESRLGSVFGASFEFLTAANEGNRRTMSAKSSVLGMFFTILSRSVRVTQLTLLSLKP